MKRKFNLLTLVAIMALMIPTVAYAMGNPTGEVTAINEASGTLTMMLADGEELIVTLPNDFDYSTVSIGLFVTVKGTWTDEGITAQWVKEADAEDVAEAAAEAAEEAAEADDEASDDDDNNADNPFCTGEKEYAHPLVVKIAADYDVAEAWVQSQFCGGLGFGQIMVALQTADVTDGDVDDLLAARAEGKGWGQIWKDAGIVGSDHANQTPPGQLKKQDKTNNGNGNGNNGNGNGQGNGNGNNGNGNGNGNSQSNNGNGSPGNSGSNSNNGNGNNNNQSTDEDD